MVSELCRRWRSGRSGKRAVVTSIACMLLIWLSLVRHFAGPDPYREQVSPLVNDEGTSQPSSTHHIPEWCKPASWPEHSPSRTILEAALDSTETDTSSTEDADEVRDRSNRRNIRSLCACLSAGSCTPNQSKGVSFANLQHNPLGIGWVLKGPFYNPSCCPGFRRVSGPPILTYGEANMILI